MADQASGLRPLRLRYPDRCVLCGVELATGADALYDSQLKTVRCASTSGAHRHASSGSKVDSGDGWAESCWR